MKFTIFLNENFFFGYLKSYLLYDNIFGKRFARELFLIFPDIIPYGMISGVLSPENTPYSPLSPGHIIMNRFIITALIFLFASQVMASDDWTKDVHLWKTGDTNRFQNALSPDGSIKVDQVYYKDTTASRVGLISTKNNSTIYVTHTSPDPENITLLWSPNSKYLALHDSSSTHSLLQVYRTTPKGFKQPMEMDFISDILKYLPIKKNDIISSGHIPVEWRNSRELTIQIRLKLENREMLSAFVRLKFFSDDTCCQIAFLFYTDKAESKLDIETILKNMPQKDRGFLQESIADLIINFNDWDRAKCSYNYQSVLTSSREELAREIEELAQRDLVVIKMDKRYLGDRSSRNNDIVEIENFIKPFGFKKIIFQQAASYLVDPTGREIIKE